MANTETTNDRESKMTATPGRKADTMTHEHILLFNHWKHGPKKVSLTNQNGQYLTTAFGKYILYETGAVYFHGSSFGHTGIYVGDSGQVV